MAIHVVNSGEDLWSIAGQYGVSISAIAEINGLETVNTIVPGLALYIPEIGRLSIRYYSVNSGDTLWSIAQRYSTSISSIISENPSLQTSNILSIGQTLRIPSPAKLNLSTLGFILPYSLESSLQSLEVNANRLTYIAITAYSLTNEGYAFMQLNDKELINRSWELNVIPLLMIRNLTNGFSAELIGKVLENPIYRNNLTRSLVQLTQERGYGGVSIDFEFIPPTRRNDFVLFLRDLKAQLGDRILHVNVHAKTEDLPQNRIVGGYDYKGIGATADLVAVMTIDYGYPTGPPDPNAPVDWVEQVVRYAITQINPRKLQIALPLYAYEKTIPSYETNAMSVQDAQNLAIKLGTTIQYNSAAQAPWYSFWSENKEHIVWFEDIRSYIEKYNLMDLYQLNGTTFWHIGLSAPQNWAYVGNHIQVVKV